ncbi:MAG: DUF6940 family protein [Microcoleaceae cyanobacterium]
MTQLQPLFSRLVDSVNSCPDASLLHVIPDQAPLTFAGQNVLMVRFLDPQGNPLTWPAIAQGLCQVPEFRELWNQTWADPVFDFQWKPVPIHPTTVDTLPFFAVLVPSAFEPADPAEFQPYLQQLGSEELVAAFPNLAGDALLVSPKVVGNYGHIAEFCQTAPQALRHTLWAQVGEIVAQAIQQQQILWCNTHGHGVPWLHIRFDSTLKYPAFPPHSEINEMTQALWYQNYDRCFGSDCSRN